MDAPSRPADQISLITVMILAFKVCFWHLGHLILLNLYFLLFSIPLITHPGAKSAMYGIVNDFLFDPSYTSVNPFQEMVKRTQIQFKRSLVVELLKWFAFIVIIFSIVFWTSGTELWQQLVAIIAIYGLVIWQLTSTFVYPVMADEQEQYGTSIIRIAGRLALSKPFECFFYTAFCFLLFLLGILLLGPILLVVPVLIALLATLGYQHLNGTDFMNVYNLAAKGY